MSEVDFAGLPLSQNGRVRVLASLFDDKGSATLSRRPKTGPPPPPVGCQTLPRGFATGGRGLRRPAMPPPQPRLYTRRSDAPRRRSSFSAPKLDDSSRALSVPHITPQSARSCDSEGNYELDMEDTYGSISPSEERRKEEDESGLGRSLLEECMSELPAYFERVGEPVPVSTTNGDADVSLSAGQEIPVRPPRSARPSPPPKPGHLSLPLRERVSSPEYAEYDDQKADQVTAVCVQPTPSQHISTPSHSTPKLLLGGLKRDDTYDCIADLPSPVTQTLTLRSLQEDWESGSEASTVQRRSSGSTVSAAMSRSAIGNFLINGEKKRRSRDPVVPEATPKEKRRLRPKLSRRLRPISQPSLEDVNQRLARIKSDIQINLSKQVDRIKLRMNGSGSVDDDASANRLARGRKSDAPRFYSVYQEQGGSGEMAGQYEEEDDPFASDWSDDPSDQEEEGGSEQPGTASTSRRSTNSGSAGRKSWGSLPDVVVSSRSGTLKAEAPELSTAYHTAAADLDDLDDPDSQHTLEDAPPLQAEEDPEAVNEPVTVELPQEEKSGEVTKPASLQFTPLEALDAPRYPRAFRNQEPEEQVYNCISSPETQEPRLPEVRLEEAVPEPETDEEDALEPSYTSRLAASQPLYQHYQAQNQRAALTLARNGSLSSAESTSEEGRSSLSCLSNSTGSGNQWAERRRQRMAGASGFGSQRSLWCEMPEVRKTGLLDALNDDAKKYQEANFEVLTSEASYLRSLNFLITHFMASPAFSGKDGLGSVVSPRERRHLFSNILAVRDASEKLLSGLEAQWEAGVMLEDVSGLLASAFAADFEPYVAYCANQVYQDRALRFLKTTNASFARVLGELEAESACEGLDMRSFLMLPMQRITRYPLLIDAILQRMEAGDTEKHAQAKKALVLANKLVRRCNEAARRMERMEQLVEIDARLSYRSADLRRIPLVSPHRYLLKHAALTQLLRPDDGAMSRSLRKSSIGALAAAAYSTTTRRRTKSVYLFLFTDLFLVCKKPKLSNNFVVKDYCPRQFVDIAPLEATSPLVPISALSSLGLSPTRRPHLFQMTLMQNARGRQVDLILAADSETDRARWIEALTRPNEAGIGGEAVYADWDCPQVQATHDYHPLQDDELPLRSGDVINVLRKMPDGWFEGERLGDGVRGWFPGSYAVEILSDHVRARNYRQRLRLIQAAESIQAEQRASVARSETVDPLLSPAKEPIPALPTSPSAAAVAAGSLRKGLRRISNPIGLF